MSFITKGFEKVYIQVILEGKQMFSIQDDRKKAFDYLWQRLNELETIYGHDRELYHIEIEFY